MGAVQGVFSVCCNALALGEGWGLASLVYRMRLGEADRGSYTRPSHKLWQLTRRLVERKDQRNPQPKFEQWALADSMIIYKPGGRRSSSTTGYQIPP